MYIVYLKSNLIQINKKKGENNLNRWGKMPRNI